MSAEGCPQATITALSTVCCGLAVSHSDSRREKPTPEWAAELLRSLMGLVSNKEQSHTKIGVEFAKSAIDSGK